MIAFKKIYQFTLTYIIRPFLYRFFVLRWELFHKPPFYFNYYGYKVYYRPKDGLVYHIGSLGSFEKDVINTSLNLIPENGVIIDVGANIGLISLPLLSLKQGLKCHAFEPSPYPYEYLSITIKKNKLEQKIKLNKVGLYEKEGRLKFYLHQFKDASGDGLKDTFRAGTTRPITVKVTTLDNYFRKNNLKKLDFIKVDVEGAEIFVFKGAVKTIKKFKPAIIFEAWPINLEVYDLQVANVFHFFQKINYSVYDLNRKKLDLEEFLKATQIDGNYLALPDTN